MKIGIIGAGNIGQAFAKHAVTTGNEVVISNSKGAESLTDIVQQIGKGLRAGSVQEAAEADIILLAVPWEKAEQVIKSTSSWKGKILLDATNAISFPEFKPLDLGNTTSSEIIASLIPDAHVIKAFNTLPAALLTANPQEGAGHRVIFYSGDNSSVKTQIEDLLTKMGFAGIDLGTLAVGGKLQQFGGPFTAKNLLKFS
ncbi:NAD(P)-binding domain-containing protein [Cytophagaceae bacterium YF14B1]|uniref:NAD(P)-binding domain-containing protein n=1 Tax=Xanthocytophaga flava TaxID=3048013 RepID=A0AAE3QVV7_9BACT|nr:NAD(P)-binding domain-containing protein [Xanthocytophaga flavus]MDJ1483744.1 NAD(P)-binding domain-containing protein [Xanthocytophaga flavus]